METFIGLRMYAAFYIVIGGMIGTVGSFFGSAIGVNGGFGAGPLSIAISAVFFFIGIVVALKGVVVLVKEVVRTELEQVEEAQTS